MVDVFGTSTYSNDELEIIVKDHFDLRPSVIIESLDLKKPIYRKLAAYGHMGREDLDVLWEEHYY